MPRTIREFWDTSLGKWALGLITVMIIGSVNQIRADVAMKTTQDAMVAQIEKLTTEVTKLTTLVNSGQVSETALSGHVATSNAELTGNVNLVTQKVDAHINQKAGAHE